MKSFAFVFCSWSFLSYLKKFLSASVQAILFIFVYHLFLYLDLFLMFWEMLVFKLSSRKESTDFLLFNESHLGNTPLLMDRIFESSSENIGAAECFSSNYGKTDDYDFLDSIGDEGAINPFFTYESFFITSGSKTAYNACLSFSDYILDTTSDEKFSAMLYLYAKSPVGKTHLLHSICNSLPKNSFAYFCGNEVVKLVSYFYKSSKSPLMLQNIKTIIFDDVDLILNQQAYIRFGFLNILKILSQLNFHIVMASKLSLLELRLLSRRFTDYLVNEEAIVAKIGSPNRDEQKAIFMIIAERYEMLCHPEIIEFVVEKLDYGISMMETIIKQIKMICCTLELSQPLDETSKNKVIAILKAVFFFHPIVATLNTPDANLIVNMTVKGFEIEYDEITKKCINFNTRLRVIKAKSIAMYLIRRIDKEVSFSEIAGIFSEKDPNIIASLIQCVDSLSAKYTPFQTVMEACVSNPSSKNLQEIANFLDGYSRFSRYISRCIHVSYFRMTLFRLPGPPFMATKRIISRYERNVFMGHVYLY
ncbi:MAG: hypothetical protein HQK54_15880 [Oligoflexales bacterium]|nr:hypothetical protein [Oligoflexales bacterium]